MNTPSVSIIILNWNGIRDTLECLASLGRLQYPNFEIFVVDNGSDNNEANDLQRQFGTWIRILKNQKNLGYAEGNNQAARIVLEEGKSDYILFLNNDTIVDADFLHRMIRVAEQDTNIGIVGPKICWYQQRDVLLFVGGDINLFFGEARHRGLFKRDDPRFQKCRSVDYIEGSAMLVKTSLLKEVGIFDSIFFCYWEDVDLSLRAKRRGWKCVIVPESRIYHKVSSSTGGDQSPRSLYLIERNRFIFMQRYASFYHWPFFLFFLLANGSKTVLKFFIQHKTNQARAYLSGIRDGFKFLLQKRVEM